MQRLSPYAVLKEVASRQPDHDAIVFDDNSRITYGEFAERVTALPAGCSMKASSQARPPGFAFATR